VSHLGDRLSALVDGELSHEARDRALAHVAHCPSCHALLDSERAVKEALASARAPKPPASVLDSLNAIALPGAPLPPRARTMPQGPVVPVLPPPGRTPRGARADSRGPSSYGGTSARRATRARYAAVGALSVAGLVLGTAFAAGAPRQPAADVVPASAELSVEHTATTSGFTVGDPGLGMSVSFGDVFYPTVPRR
jgi:hypothetical protein